MTRRRDLELTAPPRDLVTSLEHALPRDGGVRSSLSHRLAVAPDASHYVLIPQAVAAPTTAAEVAALMRVCSGRRTPLVFRSGGTSLSGQAITDGVLVDVRSGFRGLEVLDGGLRVRVQPGVTLRSVNTVLARYGRRLGPDPASEVACTVGGAIANNSAGMTCGAADSAYRTLESVTAVLPSGTVLDTGGRDADERLRQLEPDIHQGLAGLRERIMSRPGWVRQIGEQFAMRNTMGYGLNAFIDFTRPADILAHLIVGSEGTLGFIAEAVLRTRPARPYAATAFLLFSSLPAAVAAVDRLATTGADAVELFDEASLRVAQRGLAAAGVLPALDLTGCGALLVGYERAEAAELDAVLSAAEPALADLGSITPASPSTDASVRAGLWQARKGLYASVAAARPPGTVAVLEDIVVPVAEMARTCAGLAELFSARGYPGAVIFGHARHGNLHFMLTDDFDRDDRLGQYGQFLDEMADLVLSAGGSLKGEHGTGRNMAAFVRRQYGPELYAVMREVKQLFDPASLINPGVIINDDPRAHLRDLKAIQATDPQIDRCVECGYCEPVCPSRDLTLTPRQRIVLRRAMSRLDRDGDGGLASELRAGFVYPGIQTCAADGMCQAACPVGINTGDLVKRLRATEQPPPAAAALVWQTAARHWGATTRVARGLLSAADSLPGTLVTAAAGAGRRTFGPEYVPAWSPDLPRGGSRRARPAGGGGDPAAVYFPTCTASMFGPAAGGIGVQEAFLALCRRAGLAVALPSAIDGLCCGMPWRSKGMAGGYQAMRSRVLPALADASRMGELPVVCDATSCTDGLTTMLADAGSSIRVVDAIQFTATQVLPRLPSPPRQGTVVLHPTCSSSHLSLNADLQALAATVAEAVVTPASWGCCGFAGDRGLLHPELAAAATHDEAAEVRGLAADDHVSCNRTCELALTRATGQAYRHIIELVELRTRTPA